MIGYLWRRWKRRNLEERLAEYLGRVSLAESRCQDLRGSIDVITSRLQDLEARVAELEAVAHRDGLARDFDRELAQEAEARLGDTEGRVIPWPETKVHLGLVDSLPPGGGKGEV